jgi:ribonuclease R
LYRAFMMKDRIGARFEGTVTAVVGSGVFVQLDSPFVDVLVRLEDLGSDHWEVDDELLRVVAARSGGVIALGDRIAVEISDVSLLRRTVYARRAVEEKHLLPRRDRRGAAKAEKRPPKHKPKPKPQKGKKPRKRRPR